MPKFVSPFPKPFELTGFMVGEFKKEPKPAKKLGIALGTPGMTIVDLVFLPWCWVGEQLEKIGGG